MNAVMVSRLNGTSDSGRSAQNLLARYGVTPSFVSLIALRARNIALTHALASSFTTSTVTQNDAWTTLGINAATAFQAVQKSQQPSAELQRALRSEQSEDEAGEIDVATLNEQIVCAAIYGVISADSLQQKMATLYRVASASADQTVLGELFNLTSEQSPVVDLDVQLTATAALRVFIAK